MFPPFDGTVTTCDVHNTVNLNIRSCQTIRHRNLTSSSSSPIPNLNISCVHRSMASCNDDFRLIADDENPHALTLHSHHQQIFTSHHITTASAITGPKKIAGAGESDADSGNAEYYSHGHGTNSLAAEEESEPNKSGDGASNGKQNHYYYKKPKFSDCGGGSESGGEYRKDREEWSDSAISCLLDVYGDKFTQLNRGNLRGRDWMEVAEIVNEKCDKQKSCKSTEQCKNKIDNLKKRYKVELQKMNSGSLPVSRWHWFKKMESIVGNTPSFKCASDEDKSCGGSAYMLR